MDSPCREPSPPDYDGSLAGVAVGDQLGVIAVPVPAPALPAAAVYRLPRGELVPECVDRGLHPLEARRHDVAMWARQLAEQAQASTEKVQAPASIARRLSCLSSFYGYGVEVAVLEENPVANVKRPHVSTDSMSVGLRATSSSSCWMPPRPTGRGRRR